MQIILASASPRRQDLLRQAGCDFVTVPGNTAEDNTADVPPSELAVLHARQKALDVAGTMDPEDVVIGADTIVVLQGQVYGKPKDAEDVICMLTELSGKQHHVITGVAVVRGADIWTDFAVTAVNLKKLTIGEIGRYLETGEPFDKAGAYAIQGMGALLVESISGCYSNVVGLPLVTLHRLLNQAGVRLL